MTLKPCGAISEIAQRSVSDDVSERMRMRALRKQKAEIYIHSTRRANRSRGTSQKRKSLNPKGPKRIGKRARAALMRIRMMDPMLETARLQVLSVHVPRPPTTSAALGRRPPPLNFEGSRSSLKKRLPAVHEAVLLIQWSLC